MFAWLNEWLVSVRRSDDITHPLPTSAVAVAATGE